MNWGGIIGGALEGGGAYAAKHFDQEDDVRRKMELEAHQSKLSEARSMRLAETQQRMARENADYADTRARTNKLDELDPNGVIGGALRAKRQEDFDFTHSPENVKAAAASAALIDSAKGFTLAPGQEHHGGDGKVTKNSTPTAAEINMQLYREGLKKSGGGGGGGGKAGKLDPLFVQTFKDLDGEDNELSKRMNALKDKRLDVTDEAVGKQYDARLAEMQAQRLSLRDQKIGLAIDHGQMDPDAHARHLATMIKTPDQLQRVVETHREKHGEKWGAQLEAAFGKTSLATKFQALSEAGIEGKRSDQGVISTASPPSPRAPSVADKNNDLLAKPEFKGGADIYGRPTVELDPQEVARGEEISRRTNETAQRQIAESNATATAATPRTDREAAALSESVIRSLSPDAAAMTLRRLAPSLSSTQRRALSQQAGQ